MWKSNKLGRRSINRAACAKRPTTKKAPYESAGKAYNRPRKHKITIMAKNRFFWTNPHFFHFFPHSFAKPNLIFSCTWLSNVGNIVSAKMCSCTYPKSALASVFWPKKRLFALVTKFLSTGGLLPYAWRPFLLLDSSRTISLFVFEKWPL